jgi:arsenate reductase
MATTILFVCKDNAGLSPMAEACLNAVSDGSLRAFSAGIVPAGHLAPATARVLAENGIRSGGLVPKPLELFALPHAPTPDVVVALTPGVTAATGRIWAGATRHLCWTLAPGPVAASPIQQARDSFTTLRREIEMRFAGCGAGRRVLRRSA